MKSAPPSSANFVGCGRRVKNKIEITSSNMNRQDLKLFMFNPPSSTNFVDVFFMTAFNTK